MTLREFLDTTSTVSAPELRRAMVRALATEPARTPGERHRFHERVVEQLALATHMGMRRAS